MSRYCDSLVANVVDHRRAFVVYLNPSPNVKLRSRVGRIAWSLIRHPVKSREFPASHERLVTPADLLHFGF
jgi:hypothetical protein